MPLNTTTIVGPWIKPGSAGMPHRGQFTLEYLTSDGTIREPAADKVMAGTVTYDVPSSGTLNWTGIISFPQTGLKPDDNLTARISFVSQDKKFTWSTIIDT